ncbi:MAG TPA: cyclic peptide export ABC transporter [Blastocatellia bacterium]|jgi:putative ATP-binding cassette transporter
MKMLSFLLKKSRGTAVLAILAGLIAGISNTALLALINTVLTRAEQPSSTLAWGFIWLCALMLLARIVSQALLIRISVDSSFILRMQLSRKILAAPFRQLEQLGPHRLLATLTEDVPSVGGTLTIIPILCMHVSIVFACLAYLAWLSRAVFLGVLVFMIIGIITYRMPLMKGRSYQKLGREGWDSLFKHFRALTEGTKELKLHRRRREKFLSNVLEPTALSMRNNFGKGNMIYSAGASWGHLLIFILVGLLLFLVPRLTPVTPQMMVGYTLVILYMMTPIEGIVTLLPTVGLAEVALQKIEEIGLSLSSQSEEAEPVEAVTSPRWDSLELIGVTHTYYREQENSGFTLGPIDISLRPGELVFLTGGNGSGKTTLAKILTGLYAPEAGEVRFNGQPVTDENRDEYRQYFAAVFSDFYLFESLLGLEGAGLDQQAQNYLKELHLDHKVSVREGVLSTTELSQGQRKRLALLTAYLEDRPIYIFDEWAADQDPIFKAVFYYRLLPDLKTRGKAVIVISHDDRYYHIADRVIKLEYGKIEYDKLMAEYTETSAGLALQAWPGPTGFSKGNDDWPRDGE